MVKSLLTVPVLIHYSKQHGILFFQNTPQVRTRLMNIVQIFWQISHHFPLLLSRLLPWTIFAMFFLIKLRKHTATGMDGWRPHEIKHLPDCLLSALIDIFHLFLYPLLFLKARHVPHLVLGPSLSFLSPIVCTLVYGVKLFFPGKILGYMHLNTLFVEVAAPLVLMRICPLIFCHGTTPEVVLQVSNLTSLNVSILYHTRLFGLFYLIMVLILLSFHFCPISILIFLVVSDMRDVLALFGLLQMAYFKVILSVLLFLIAFCVPLCTSSLLSVISLFMLSLMILLLFLRLGDSLLQAYGVLQAFSSTTDMRLNLNKMSTLE